MTSNIMKSSRGTLSHNHTRKLRPVTCSGPYIGVLAVYSTCLEVQILWLPLTEAVLSNP